MGLNYIDMVHICAVCRQEHPEASCEELVGAGGCEVVRAEAAAGLCDLKPNG